MLPAFVKENERWIPVWAADRADRLPERVAMIEKCPNPWCLNDDTCPLCPLKIENKDIYDAMTATVATGFPEPHEIYWYFPEGIATKDQLRIVVRPDIQTDVDANTQMHKEDEWIEWLASIKDFHQIEMFHNKRVFFMKNEQEFQKKYGERLRCLMEEFCHPFIEQDIYTKTLFLCHQAREEKTIFKMLIEPVTKHLIGFFVSKQKLYWLEPPLPLDQLPLNAEMFPKSKTEWQKFLDKNHLDPKTYQVIRLKENIPQVLIQLQLTHHQTFDGLKVIRKINIDNEPWGWMINRKFLWHPRTRKWYKCKSSSEKMKCRELKLTTDHNLIQYCERNSIPISSGEFKKLSLEYVIENTNNNSLHSG